MDKFEEYIVDTQENRKLSTGFKRLDACSAMAFIKEVTL